MAEKKITIKDNFMAVREVLEAQGLDNLVAFIDERIAQHDKKAGNRKPNAAQVMRAEIADKVYADMEIGKQYTVTEMMKAIPSFAEIDGLTQSYANTVVKLLKDTDRVCRTEIKGRPYFTKVVEE